MAKNVGVNLVEGQGVSAIDGVSTAVSTIVGVFQKGPLNKATLVTSMAEFESKFGTAPIGASTAYYSVKAFFKAVGTSAPLYIVRVAHSTALKSTVTLTDRNGSPLNTLRVDALSEGSWGNLLSVSVADYARLTTKPAANILSSATQATLVSVDGLEVGSDLKFYNGTNTEYRRVATLDVNTRLVTWSTGLTNAYSTTNGVITSMEFTLSVYSNAVLVEQHVGCSMNNSVSFFVVKKVSSNYISVTDLKSSDSSYLDMPSVIVTPSPLISGADGFTDVVAADYIGVQSSKSGLYAMDEIDTLFRFCIPNPSLTDVSYATAYETLVQAALDYANSRVTVQFYADVEVGKSVASAKLFTDKFSGRRIAFFWPWFKVYENNVLMTLPPSSLVLGTAVAKDYSKGVHKNIGNEQLAYAVDLEYHVSVAEGETLNDAGVNTIRRMSGMGIRTYGGRTRSSQTAWRFLHYSEYWSYVARSLTLATTDIPFQPNDSSTWKSVIRRASAFLAKEQSNGALFNSAQPGAAAYRVVMDETINPPDQIALGYAVCQIEYIPVGTIEKFTIELTSSPTGFVTK